MKIITRISSLLFLILLIACGTNEATEQEVANTSRTDSITNQKIAISEDDFYSPEVSNNISMTEIQFDGDITFKQFINEFFSDSLFQVNHIKFPLEVWYYAEVELGLADTLSKFQFNVDEWRFDNLSVRDRVDITSREENGQNILFLRGKDNAIQIEYVFVKGDESWELVKITDSGN